MNAYGYCRVSTGDQAMSIQSQRAAIETYYSAMLAPKGFTWGGWYVDEGVSGKVPIWDRPDGSKLQLAANKGDTIICAKLDRGFRRLKDLVVVMDALASRGVHLQLLDLGIDTTTDVGRLMVHIMGCFAEWERTRIAERTRESKQMRRRLGLSAAPQAPFGFRRVRRHCEATGKLEWHLERDEQERAIGAAILDFRAQGWAWKKIAEHLNTNKIFARGLRWTDARVMMYRRRELALREAEGKQGGQTA